MTSGTRTVDWLPARLLSGLIVCAALLSGGMGACADDVRERFLSAWDAAAEGDFAIARAALPQLADYPLTPYLQARLLQPRSTDTDAAAVQEFLQANADSIVAADVRRQWLAAMARSGDWQSYLRHYDAGIATVEHQCWRLRALLETGATARLLADTSALWMRADSLPAACDPAFRYWLASGQRTQPMVWQRLMLAVEHDNVRLARYLISELQGDYKTQGQRLLQLHRNPGKLAAQLSAVGKGPHADAVLRHLLMRLASLDRTAADQLWVQLTSSGKLRDDTAFDTRRAIARQFIAADGPATLPWLLQRDPDASDSYLLEWRIRLALQQLNWQAVDHWIALLPPELAAEPRWRYWQGRALLALNPGAPRITELLGALAQERNFYGFLAADLLAIDYQFSEQPLQPGIDPETLEQRPAIARAREWLALGEPRRARREWYAALSGMQREEQQAAALLANQWEWHDQAIRTAIRSDAWDDLQVRFPLAYADAIHHHAGHSAITPQWLFAVARQESSFSPDAQSPAGARGLLQLMPGTARELAGRLGRPYQLQKLYDAEYSLELGSRYLAELLTDFNGSRVLATAAYNAGPARVGRVLAQQQQPLPADVWIESLPYFETRGYIQSVLSFAVIYQHRMGLTGPLLAPEERQITPMPELLAKQSNTQ